MWSRSKNEYSLLVDAYLFYPTVHVVASSNLLLDPGAEVSNSMEGPWEYQSPPASGQKASKKNVLGGIEGMGGVACGVGGRVRSEE